MVFESIVADLLNRFLGDYVENLDRSQLKIGIWGGDVVLQDLVLKQSALDDLNLPVKTSYGNLGKLVLKIPWKNLYSAPVEATIERLYLLVMPSQEVHYDQAKEEKWNQEAKKAELEKIESAKKEEKEKNKPKPDDTFVEKLATQIIKNVQVKISDIHIRYEDKVTNPEHPFALGITLHNLSVKTTDENWKEHIVQDAATMIYKLLNLEGLALYWNPATEFFAASQIDVTHLHKLFQDGICTKQYRPKKYNYMLGPINSSSHLRLNPKPENDGSNYSIPKVWLSLVMEKLSIGITKVQFHNLIDLLESFDRMSRAAPYRKYRPSVSSYRGHYKEWWHFAYTCVLEENVRRRRRNWNWLHMLEHRTMCRKYAEAYHIKLTSKKIPAEVQNTIDEAEKMLDVLNIVLIRQRVEMEVEKHDKKLQESKKQASWFGGWFGGGKTNVEEEEALSAAAIAKKFEEAMTPEEKAKLYRAIDYKENAMPTGYPKTFVEISLSFRLNSLEVQVIDELQQVLNSKLNGVVCRMEQRPSADAMKATVAIEELAVFGLNQENVVPQLVKSEITSSKEVLLDVLFEKNPLDELCDQRIHVTSKPIRIVYDAQTINKIVDVFKAPKEVQLSQLQAAAESRMQDFKEMSTVGLQYAIEQHSVMDLKVDLKSSYVIIPHGGFYTEKENVVVVNLGRVKMSSIPRDREAANVRQLFKDGSTEDEVLKTVISESYDKFKIELEEIQIRFFQVFHTLEIRFLQFDYHLFYECSSITHSGTNLYNTLPEHYKEMGTITSWTIVCTFSYFLQLIVAAKTFDPSSSGPKAEGLGQWCMKQFSYTKNVLIATPEDDWHSVLQENQATPMHLLLPTNLGIQLEKCLILDDPRLPKLKVAGSLPNVAITVKEESLLNVIALFSSIPFPSDEEVQMHPLQESGSHSSTLSVISKHLEFHSDRKRKISVATAEEEEKELIQAIEMEMKFEMKEFSVSMYQKTAAEKLLDFHVLCLEVDMVKQTFDMKVSLCIGGISLVYHDSLGDIQMIETPMSAGNTDYLFAVTYVNVDAKSPEFRTKHESVKMLLDVTFTKLNLLLHQEALVTLMTVSNNFQKSLEEIQKQQPKDRIVSQPSPSSIPSKMPLLTIPEDETVTTRTTKSFISEKHRKRKEKEDIELKLTAHLEHVKVQIESRRLKLAALKVEGIVASVILKKSSTNIAAKLKDIDIVNLNSESFHTHILSITEDEALSAEVVMYNQEENEADADADALDLSVKMKMACMRVIFLNSFVTNILKFLNYFQEAQQAIINAAAGAAEAAKQNVQQAYSKAVKIALCLNLQAPIIVIPVNSRSLDALMLDLGNLTISNKFRTLEVQNKLGHPAVLDEIQLALQNVKLSRVHLDEKAAEVIGESRILRPITFDLLVKRNLSVGWFKEIPDIDMSGHLDTITWKEGVKTDILKCLNTVCGQEAVAQKTVHSWITGFATEGNHPSTLLSLRNIEITLGQDDFSMIMLVTSENLTEGQDDITGEPPVECEDVKPMQRPTSLAGIKSSTSEDVTSKDAEIPADCAPVHTSMKFTFTMDSLIVNLFTSPPKEKGDFKIADNTPEQGLARFSIHILSLKGKMLTDGSLTTSILLIDCLMDDTRVNSDTKIKRLMERKSDTSDASESNAVKSMMDITFQKKGADTFVDVRVFGFTLILCLKYLMTVSQFFATQEQAKSAPATQEIAQSTVKQTKSVAKRSTKAAEPVSSEPYMMTINLRIEKPDIILVEDMQDLNTKAVILDSEITFKLRMTKDHQVMNGTVKDLQLYSCCFNVEKRKETTAQILHPCTISLAGSTPENSGLHLDVCTTEIRLAVSPATIELLCNIQRSLVVSDAEDDVEKKEEDYSDIWKPKKFTDTDYWFLKTEMGEDVVKLEPLTAETQAPTGELCMVSAPSVIITMEAGVGNQTLPMILVNMGFQGAVTEWSTQMNLTSSLTLQISYYNSQLALWEPLIEPVEQLKDGKIEHVPWELCAEVQMNKQEPLMSPSSITASTSELEELPYVPPAMAIEISSKENLELTVTKTCLEVLSNLGKAFSSAVRQDASRRKEPVAPYLVKNDTGLVITLLLEKGPFQVLDVTNGGGVKQVVLQNGAQVGLCLKNPDVMPLSILSVSTPTREKTIPERMLTVKINELKDDCQLELPLMRTDKRYFSLNHRGDSNDIWGVVSDVTVEDGGTIVTLRSIIQVHNHFNEAIDVYYMTRRGNEVECIGTVGPNEQLNLPLYSVYTPTNELFFSVKGYTVSVVPFVWKDLQNELTATKLLQCEPKNKKDLEPFFMKIVGEMEQVYFDNTSRHTMASTCYNIQLRPAVILRNYLPVDLICCVQGIPIEKPIKAGGSIQMPTAEPGNTTVVLRIVDYLDREWSCKHEIQLNAPELGVWTFDSYDSVQKASMDLGMHTITKNGSIVMSLYCPFWMLNKTGFMLSYRKSRKIDKNETAGSPIKKWASNLSLASNRHSTNKDVPEGTAATVQAEESANVLYHNEDFKGPILFSFKAKSFFGKKKASIKVEDGEWSDKFSLDVAGSSGVVACTKGDTVYQIGVSIQLTNSSLTKQVIFMPYYVLVNHADFIIECQEADRPADSWVKVQPEECTPLWPRSMEENKCLRIRVHGFSEMSAPFSYTTVHSTMLKLNNKYGGIHVDVQMTEGAVYITFTAYKPGLAPALFLNHTSEPIILKEKDSVFQITLQPKRSSLYTFEDPCGSRCITWSSGKKKEISDDLRKDGIGEFSSESGAKIWWVSFLDGIQRVLLFTPDMAIARDALSSGEMEAISQEITLSLHGIGISLVNNIASVEVMYLGIASSGITWEVRKSHNKRYKPLSLKECQLIEQAYIKYNMEKALEKMVSSRVIVDNKTEVDFETNEMIRPNKRQMRRTFQTGVWFQMKTSPHLLQLHAKLNRLQIDNQMYDCVFPIVLAPVPPPKSVAADSAPKPFAELSIVQRLMVYSSVQQYKYFKALIQEFHVKVDMGFINGLLYMFQPEETTEEEAVRLFEEDRQLVDKPLMAHVSLVSSQEQKNFYDLLHFSPLKIHLSFSLSGGANSKMPGQESPQFINVLLQSLGVTLTDVQDVIFKLAYFERQYVFLTQQQLISEATMHYVGQSLKQLYVLVLGLDVIGNPYGLVLGLRQGVEDLFYEPFQGAIQGPGEFAEGLVLGVRSLFGHTVGGAAGAMSRITGAMGKGIAALTFDKEYQRKRREQLQHRPANVQTGLARSGKGLVMGIVDGVSGVIMKPISGAKQEGVEGFFKGIGKGVMGLVTRPTAGVIDFASGSLDVVKRATEMSDEITRLRPPRFLHQDGLVRPYIRLEAEGNKLLQALEKGRYASTDMYIFHMPIAEKDILMLTDQRVMYLVHNDIFGGWQVEWDYTWKSLTKPPEVVDKGVFITTGESSKKKKNLLGFFGHGDTGKVILIFDAETKEWLAKKMQQLMKA